MGIFSTLLPWALVFSSFGHAVSHQFRRQDASCISPDPVNTLTDRMNIALNSSGPGYTLYLCQNTQYLIEAPIAFAFHDQEISTIGYPTDDKRATLVVNGPVFNGTGHTTAIDGTCPDCSGIRLRNIQINGTRADASPTGGGANIEFGGDNSNQLIEYVHSYDPRSWSCLHLFEGSLQCNSAVVRNNDIGPCGTDTFMQWADGISVSCRNATVINNIVTGATDGGVVLFGAPGSTVENNTIQAMDHTQLGGINMVDVAPWGGDYTGVVVQNNLIIGGVADPVAGVEAAKGTNDDNVIIKIGIAIGPRTWFVDYFEQNVSFAGAVLNNNFTGAFGYAMAISSARNFTVQSNVLTGNTSFIGSRGPNCTEGETIAQSNPFIVAWPNVTDSSVQTDFTSVENADGLTCVVPPDGGSFWPYDNAPSGTIPGGSPQTSQPASGNSSSGGGGLSAGDKAGIAIGVIVGVLAVAVATWFIRKRALHKMASHSNTY